MQSVPITTKVIVSSNPLQGEVYSIQYYVVKFIGEFRQVGGFLQVLRFRLPMKLTTTIYLKYCRNTINPNRKPLSIHPYIKIKFKKATN